MRAYGLSALLAACLFHYPVTVDAASSDTATEPGIDQAIKDLLKDGKTSADSPLLPLAVDWIYAGDSKSAYPFVENVLTGKGILLKTRLPITGQPERPQRDLNELLDKIRSACSSSGGALVHREMPMALPAAEVPQVARGFSALLKENLMGQFWCENTKDAPFFLVEVLPSSGARVPLIPIGWDWNIALRPVSGAVLSQHVKRQAEYEQSVATLRTALKVGDSVQIRTVDLPDSLIASWQKRVPRQVGNICGLVTEVKRPLAKVQFQTIELNVDIEKLFPQGSKKSLEEITVSDRLQPQSWCLR